MISENGSSKTGHLPCLRGKSLANASGWGSVIRRLVSRGSPSGRSAPTSPVNGGGKDKHCKPIQAQ